jgi:hypothetical protein
MRQAGYEDGLDGRPAAFLELDYQRGWRRGVSQRPGGIMAKRGTANFGGKKAPPFKKKGAAPKAPAKRAAAPKAPAKRGKGK